MNDNSPAKNKWMFSNNGGIEEFLLLRSYIVTARKNGVGAGKALRALFQGKAPTLYAQIGKLR
jgi:hypothetical protein